MKNRSALEDALDLHSEAVKSIVGRAESLSTAEWSEPLGDGKWSPAEIFAHLNQTYVTAIRELRGGEGMRIRTKFWQRMVLRLTILPSILKGKGFPKGAVAPRETRPTEIIGLRDAVDLFTGHAAELEEAARLAPKAQKITHAYFGSASVAKGVTLSAMHIRHHEAQLPPRGTATLSG